MCLISYEPSTTRMSDGKENLAHVGIVSDAPSQWRSLQGTGCMHTSPVHTDIQSTLHPTLNGCFVD
jgi:hypothetical protein